MKPLLKAAVICSKGIGDGLMMMVASHRLQLEGYEVTTFQDSLYQLAPFFPGHHFEKRSSIVNLQKFSLILLQNDNTPLSLEIIQTYRSQLSVFYSSYCKEKHSPLTSLDRVFDRSQTMVENIATATASILKAHESYKSNGIVIPSDLIHRKHRNRILIHPTSTSTQRTYTPSKFLKIATCLQKKGTEVVFCVSPQERSEWLSRVQNRFLVPEFYSLKELATYVYESSFLIGNESGTGHLASNLGIPTLIIASCPKQMALWRPGFLLGKVITPSKYIPNFKGFRLRQNQWQRCIPTQRILREISL